MLYMKPFQFSPTSNSAYVQVEITLNKKVVVVLVLFYCISPQADSNSQKKGNQLNGNNSINVNRILEISIIPANELRPLLPE